jgi:serine/threonine protein kinase
MPAKFIPVGTPATDLERNALRFLVEGLPSNYTVYGNPFITERSGNVYELDAVVEAPHAIYVVEIKGFRGDILGSDHDWWVPDPIRSPVPLNRKTAQILVDALRRSSFDAGRVYVEGLVFLCQARSFRPTGPVSKACVHLRDTILQELQNPEALFRRSNRGRTPPVDQHVSQTLLALLKQKPASVQNRRLHGYELEAVLEQNERHIEWLARHDLRRTRHVLRLYRLNPLATTEEQQKVRARCTWEAQVLTRIARHPHILQAEAPFEADGQIGLPFEYFYGVSLPTWIGKHASKLQGREGLKARVALWRSVAEAIAYAHEQGVIHRVLRPEVILLQDQADQPGLRITGFDLAKQLHAQGTALLSTLSDDRLRWAAPEVIQGFSSAEPSADQFALGAVLGFLLAGKPLFEATKDLILRRGQMIHLRDANPVIPQSLEKAVHRMLALRPADRFPSTSEAIAAVLQAMDGKAPAAPSAPASFNPEAIEDGTRIGPDYEIQRKLGTGGLATVYAARHLVSGARRALKVARPEEGAEQALMEEYEVLSLLNHSAIVRVVDLSNIIPERKTMVMDRINGDPLSRWLTEHTSPNPQLLRRFAEDLLGALIYLEERGIIHKDLKPENLIAGDEGLTVIDFSLAKKGNDELLIGTPLYRDPVLDRWTHGSDRYAAALCLHELFCGRHAFRALAPGPEEEPDIDESELEPPTLADFFRKGLAPRTADRFPSAVAMQAAFRQALGQKNGHSVPPPSSRRTAVTDASQTLATFFSEGTAQLLRRAGIRTQGDLAGTPEETLRQLPNLGNKKRAEILDVRRELLERGVQPGSGVVSERRPLWPTLVGDQAPLQRLELPPALLTVLLKAGYTAVGGLADATRDKLISIPSVGPGRISQIVGALQTFAEHQAGSKNTCSLLQLWEKAAAPLVAGQREILELTYGLRGGIENQRQIAALQSSTQSAVSQGKNRALDLLDLRHLEEAHDLLFQALLASGGLLPLQEATHRLEDTFPAGEELQASGMIRLLCDLYPTEFTFLQVPEEGGSLVELVARSYFSVAPLQAFLKLAQQQASRWPEQASPEAVRREMRASLPEYDLDPLMLATRLLDNLFLTDNGELYQAPIMLPQAISYLLQRTRLPLPLEQFRRLIETTFGEALVPPEPEHIAEHLKTHPGVRIEGELIVPRSSQASPEPRPSWDPLPSELKVQQKTPEQVVGGLLRAAAREARFRLLVAPVETHVEISRSVQRTLGPDAVLVSFEHQLLAHMEAQNFASFERAEQFRKTMRPRLKKAAEEVLQQILEAHGRPGQAVVLADLGPLELCDASYLIRQLYDATLSSNRGFWAVVLPGMLWQEHAYLNENKELPVFSLSGATLPLLNPIPTT